jgi:hypothetical protein
MPLASPRRIAGARVAAATIIGAAVLACFPIVVGFVRHDGAPIGADTPVYVWWARLIGAAGASTIAFRPGLPVATEVVARTFGLPEGAVVAGLGCALIAMVGLAASALLRSGGERSRVALIGLILTGLFGTYLAAGHLSNAVFAALFVLALAFQLEQRAIASVLAAALLGAAGLAHPDFLWLAVAILAVAAALAVIAGSRREGTSIAVIGLAGAGVTAVGLLVASAGSVAFDVPTSLDVFLLQTHQIDRLHQLFLERFVPKVAGYALWAWLPLAAVAIPKLRGRLGRLLVAWSAVTLVGVVAGLAGQWFPPHRVVAFAFCLPAVAAVGIGVIGDRLPRLATPVAVIAVALIATSAVSLWVRAPRPYTDPATNAVTAVAPTVLLTSGTVVVDLPADRDATAVAVIRSLNLLRAAVPGDRVRDVVLRYPAPSDGDTDALSLWRATEDAAVGALANGSATEMTAPVSPPSAPPMRVVDTFLATIAWLAVCGLAGSGWCLAAGHRGVALVERATGTGLAGLILAGLALDQLGLRLASRPVSIGVVAAVTIAGFLTAAAAGWSRGRRLPRAPGASTTRATHGSLPSSTAPALP